MGTQPLLPLTSSSRLRTSPEEAIAHLDEGEFGIAVSYLEDEYGLIRWPFDERRRSSWLHRMGHPGVASPSSRTDEMVPMTRLF